MPRTGRPRTHAKVIHRVCVARPERNDSKIMWTGKSLDEIKKLHGDKLLSVEEFHRIKVIYQRGQ